MKAKEKLARNLDEIRELYATGNYRHIDLAKKYNVCKSSMSQFAKIHGLKKPEKQVDFKTKNIKADPFEIKVLKEKQKELDIIIYQSNLFDISQKSYIIDTKGKNKFDIRVLIESSINHRISSRIYLPPDGMEHKFSDIMIEENIVKGA